ncbi:TonB C-terminal domain-containing protein [Myxococcus stipitatus]|uniref:TonB C-terminal domain-containing protein n=1 Tax=Myxococcus stipitatus TaxID=83455 RepID=UPI0031454063
MRRSRRLGWAALASLVIHAALLGFLANTEPPARPSPRQRESKPAPVFMEVVHAPPKVPSAPAVEEAPKPPRDSVPPRTTRRTETPVKPPREAEPVSRTPERNDTPRASSPGLNLLPRAPGGLSLPSGPPFQSGHTLRPGDPGPSREALIAEERERVRGRVQGHIDDQQAALRVANGLVDPYFTEVRKALEKGFEDAPVFPGNPLGKQIATSWASQAGKFGASGSPGGPVPKAATASEQLKALEGRLGRNTLEHLRGRVQAGAELHQVAEGGGGKLVVTLELLQAPDGTLREARLVSVSGIPAYDTFVLNAVPGALAKLPPPRDGARGVKPEGIHTLWSVEGRVVYYRKVKDLKGRSALYLATAMAAGVLAGRFEETTGEIEVIDFTNPRFLCQSKLLRVY